MDDLAWHPSELPIELREFWQEREAIMVSNGMNPEEAQLRANAEVLWRVHQTDPGRAQRLAWAMGDDLAAALRLHADIFQHVGA